MKKNLLVLTFMLFAIFAFGQKLPFQGKLIEADTAVVGTRDFVFEISSVGWSEPHNGVTVTDGLYFVVLGSINPLPDSLFYGVDEQNMNITVGGTALSPVVLFKPLSSPFEGSKLVVKNDEGTVVGSMHALKDSVNKNGELVVNGTNGNLNFSVTGWGEGGNRGSIAVHDAEGDMKASMFTYNNVGRLKLYGENTGRLNMGFSKPWDPNGGETIRDLPSVSLEVDGLYYSNLYTTQWDTVTAGRFYLASNNGEFLNLRTDRIQLQKENKNIFNLGFQNWNGHGNAGYFQLFGPNSRNIDINSRHWEDPDIPMILLNGRDSVTVVEISAETDSTESGKIILSSKTDKSLYMNAEHINVMADQGNTWIGNQGINIHTNSDKELNLSSQRVSLRHTAENEWRETAILSTQNHNGNGWEGVLDLMGPASTNVHIGSRNWNDANLPQINLYGKEDFHAMELSVSEDSTEAAYINLNSLNGRSSNIGSGSIGFRGPNSQNIDMGSKEWEDDNFGYINMWGRNDGQHDFHAIDISVSEDNGQQFGYINLMSENGKSLHLSPNGFGAEGVGMETHNKDSLKYGHLYTRGPNTTNFETGGQWDNPDRAYLNLNGASDQNLMHFGIYENEQQVEYGHINVISEDKKETQIEPQSIRLIQADDGNWRRFAALETRVLQDGNSKAGSIELRGESSSNIDLGGRWENSDLPALSLYGEDDFHAMELSAYTDGNGYQEGWLNISASTGRFVGLNPNSLTLHSIGGQQTIAMETRDHGQGEHGHFHLNGPSTTNVESGTHDNPNRPHINLNGETDANRVTFIVEDNDYGNEAGRLWTYSADEKLSITEATRVGLVDNSSGGWKELAMMHIHNNSGNGWVGNLNLAGASSNNFEMGATGHNADLPWMVLRGKRTDLMRISGDDSNSNELGYMSILSEDGNENHVNGYGMYINSSPTMNSSFDSYRLFFHDNGKELYYTADGINGNGTINLHGGAEVHSGNLHVNGDITATGTITPSSDRRFKTNIQSIGTTLPKVKLIEGVSYNWRQDEFPKKNFSSDKQIGVIAQELEAQFPELVKTDKEGYKSVNYNGFTAVLLEAVKELNAKVEKLETENIQLKTELSASVNNTSEIAELKEQMQALVKMLQLQQAEESVEDLTSTPGLN